MDTIKSSLDESPGEAAKTLEEKTVKISVSSVPWTQDSDQHWGMKLSQRGVDWMVRVRAVFQMQPTEDAEEGT